MKIRRDPSTKPYYRCLSCARFRKECGGIPTRDLDLQNWCEYMRDVKEVAHLTNAYIAREADVSEKKIDDIMAINCDHDILRATARRVERVVIGPVTKYFCDMDYDNSMAAEQTAALLARIEELEEDNKRYKKIIDKLYG